MARITASLKSPVFGSPVGLNATAPGFVSAARWARRLAVSALGRFGRLKRDKVAVNIPAKRQDDVVIAYQSMRHYPLALLSTTAGCCSFKQPLNLVCRHRFAE